LTGPKVAVNEAEAGQPLCGIVAELGLGLIGGWH
jgi:hypothetical protein